MNTFSEVDLSLDIQSNVDYPVTINILGNPYNLLDTTNAKTEYRWNVTSFTFTTETKVTVEYKLNSDATFNTFTQDLSAQTLESVVSALNLLGIGFFNTYTQLGQTYIGTYNDNYTFGDLNIFPTASTSILNTVFVPLVFNAQTTAVKVQADGKILYGGQFTQYNSITTNRIVRLETDGTVDATFNIGTGFSGGDVFDIDIQADGKIICVGGFTSYNGTLCNKIVRLNTNGSIDGSFVYGTGFNIPVIFGSAVQVQAVKVLASGQIMVVGGMDDYNGSAINGICRLNSNGSIDGTFLLLAGVIVAAGNFCTSVAEQVDGKYIVTGSYSLFNGVTKNRIVRLNTNGTIDGTFGGTGFTGALTLDADIQADGKIVVCGNFGDYDGTSSPNIARINTDGTIDSTFLVGAGFDSLTGNSILTLTNGKIIVVGQFTTYQSSSYNRIIRLNSDGSIDTTWNVNNGFDQQTAAVSINTAETLVYVAGLFASFDGTTRIRACSLIL
jgi:uncharacterized delta-60 repeat protein